MFEQFMKSIFAYFIKVEPMNAYIQKIPVDVQYPCYLLYKVDVNTTALNSYYFMNTIHPYIRCFGTDEIELKNRVSNLVKHIFAEHRKIPILNEDGSVSDRFIRIEDIETIDITVGENEIYCVEINFAFDTTHNVNIKDFDLLQNVIINENEIGGEV